MGRTQVTTFIRAISAETADTGGAFLKCLKDNTVVEIIPLDKKSYYVFGRAEQGEGANSRAFY